MVKVKLTNKELESHAIHIIKIKASDVHYACIAQD
jgi:hypothetical protein